MATIDLLTCEGAHHTVVALGGELDVTSSGPVEAAAAEVVTTGRSVILDVAGLEFIDCAALGALQRWQACARAAGAGLLLAAPGGVVLRLLTLTKMTDTVRVYATVAAAVAAAGDGSARVGIPERAAVPSGGDEALSHAAVAGRATASRPERERAPARCAT